MEQTWGKWMRVERVTGRNSATNDATRTEDIVINLDHVSQVRQFLGGTTFVMGEGDWVETTTDFEVACTALMLAQGPRPPMTREEVARSEYEPVPLKRPSSEDPMPPEHAKFNHPFARP